MQRPFLQVYSVILQQAARPSSRPIANLTSIPETNQTTASAQSQSYITTEMKTSAQTFQIKFQWTDCIIDLILL